LITASNPAAPNFVTLSIRLFASPIPGHYVHGIIHETLPEWNRAKTMLPVVLALFSCGKHAQKFGADWTSMSGDMLAGKWTVRKKKQNRHTHHNTPLPYITGKKVLKSE